MEPPQDHPYLASGHASNTDSSNPSNTSTQFRIFVEGEQDRNEDHTSLDRTLSEKHVNMMTFSAVIGVGLFLQNGRIIHMAGPGMAWISYVLMGTVVWSVQAALGEMTALYPVPGALFELPRRFLDRSIGFAVGWMAWFAWVIVVAVEIQAVSGLFGFNLTAYGHKIRWSTAGVDPAVWVAVFLPFVIISNMIRVRWFGYVEYYIGILKMLFIVGLIMFNIIINVRTRTFDKFYQSPWGFISRAWETQNGVIVTGFKGHLAGVWSAMIHTGFSMMGFEMVAVTAAENKKLYTFEGVKISSRKIALRIIVLYTLLTFVVGLNIPYDDENLRNLNIAALENGSHSAFVIAAFRANEPRWGSFFNGFFILSATSSGMNSLYLSSRLLHALALSDEAWPRSRLFRKVQNWLKQTGSKGVPRHAVYVSASFGLLAFLSTGMFPALQLGRLALNSTVSMLIVYCVICFTFLKFKTTIQLAATGQTMQDNKILNISPDQNLLAYSRKKSTRSYPYRSNWQPLRSIYALVACILLTLTSGWRSFSPFSAPDFIAYYISIFVFIALSIGYRWYLHRELSLRLHPTLDLSHPIMADPDDPKYGRDKLQFHQADDLWTRIEKFRMWFWIWLK